MKRHYLLLAWLVCASLTQATEFTVTNTEDDGAGSLRQAILDANAAVGNDTITFAATGTITLASALPTITGNTTIIGPGTNLLSISGNNAVRIFSMSSWTSNTLIGLTITSGYLTNYLPLPATKTYLAGAGISNVGTLRLQNCLIKDCKNYTQNGSMIGNGGGGGIYNSGNMVMQQCTVAYCGAFYSGTGSTGGGILNRGNLRMEDCTVANCEAGWGGGGIYNSGANLYLTNCLITDCRAWEREFGGGIYGGNLTMISSTVSNCRACWYAGIGGATCTITNSSIVGNRAHEFGGGITAGNGSVLFGCTISGNSCSKGGAGVYAGNLKLFNCTISGNNGNGILVGNGASAYLEHCTVVSNIPLRTYYLLSRPGTLRARNSLIGGSFSDNIVSGEFSNDYIVSGEFSNDYIVSGELTSEGYNLVQDTNGCKIVGDTTGNIYGADPLLGPLQNNGGPAWTHALSSGSPAIDRANAGGLLTDQRGKFRPDDDPTIPNIGDGSDMGAFELSPSPLLRTALSDAGMMIIWPAAWVGFILEQTTDPTSPGWTPVGITPIENGPDKQVLVPVMPENKLFRLHKP